MDGELPLVEEANKMKEKIKIGTYQQRTGTCHHKHNQKQAGI